MIDALSWRASSELVRSSAMRRRGGRPAFTRRRASRGGRSYACLARKPCTPARCTATSAQGKEPPTRGRTPPRSLLESDKSSQPSAVNAHTLASTEAGVALLFTSGVLSATGGFEGPRHAVGPRRLPFGLREAGPRALTDGPRDESAAWATLRSVLERLSQMIPVCSELPT